MFCKKCGTELQDDDNFCFNCGTPVDQKHEAKNISEDVIIPEKEDVSEEIVAETVVVEDEFLDLNEELVDEDVIWEEAPGEELILPSDKSDDEFEEVAKSVDAKLTESNDTTTDVVSDDVVVDDVVVDDVVVDDVVVDDVVVDDVVDETVTEDVEEIVVDDVDSDDDVIVVSEEVEAVPKEVVVETPQAVTQAEEVITGVETVNVEDIAKKVDGPVIKQLNEVEESTGPILEDVETDVKAKLTKENVEKTVSVPGAAAVGKLTDKFKKSSDDVKDTIPELKETNITSNVPSHAESSLEYDEELESKLNIANRDELEEVEYDLEENVNSFTSKVISLLIIILIIIIAIVVGTFLFQNLA